MKKVTAQEDEEAHVVKERERERERNSFLAPSTGIN